MASLTQSQFPILGIPVHLLPNTTQTLKDRLADRQGTHVVTLNAEMTMQGRDRPQLSDIIHRAELVIPDGAGIVLYLKLYGKQVDRVPGIELAEALLPMPPPPKTAFSFTAAHPRSRLKRPAL